MKKYYNKLIDLGMRNHCAAAMIELTNKCNAQCDYCYIADKTSPDLQTGEIFKIIDKLADAGIMHLNLTGGEIFIREDILKILSYIIQKDFWSIGLLTNGILVQDKHLDFLRTHCRTMNIIRISIFSHIPEVHDEYVGVPGAFKKAEYVCKQLHEAKVAFQIALNILDINYKSINETVTYFTKSGYNVKLGIEKIITPDGSYPVRQNKSRIKKSTSYEFYCTMLQYYPPATLEDLKRYVQKRESCTIAAEERLLCPGVLTSICIDFKGNIKPCVSFRNLNIGNIFEHGSLHEILQRSRKLREIKSLRLSDLYPCKDCENNNICITCPGLIHTESGKINKTSKHICNYAHAARNVIKFN